jgi:hypothetical protein
MTADGKPSPEGDLAQAGRSWAVLCGDGRGRSSLPVSGAAAARQCVRPAGC